MDTLQRLHVADLVHFAPELTLLIAAVVLSALDLVLPRRVNRAFVGWLSLASLVAAALLSVRQLGMESPVALLHQSFRVDDFAVLLKLLFLAGTALTMLMSLGLRSGEIGTEDVGEYYYFYLPATLGAMIAVSSADLVTMYVGLELLSIASYILVGMRKKVSVSNEGAFKYIVMGGVSAFILYGMFFLYGMSGSTNLYDIARALGSGYEQFTALAYVSFFLLITGLGFKVAAFPFHAWAPDVYQGAPTPVAAYLAVVSKAAGLALLFRLVYTVYYGAGDEAASLKSDVFLTLAVLAAAAMIVGNAMALRQANTKRLLALSGIANAGYLLVPMSAEISLFHTSGFSEWFYYLVAYLLMNIGAFAAIALMEKTEGHAELGGFAGLYHRAPLTAFAVVLIVLSLAGIPVTAGFFGKLFILFGALHVKMYWLALIMIVTSIVSYYYYFGFVRQMFMRPGEGTSSVRVPVLLGITLWLTAIAGVALGFFPNAAISVLDRMFQFGADLLS